MSRRPNKDHLETLHEYGLYVPTRTIFMDSSSQEDGEETGVNYFMAVRFCKNLHHLESVSKDPVIIILNTGGGSVDAGMAIYDEIKNSPCHITVVVKGQASSMGSVILQAADERVLRPNASVMFHSGSMPIGGNNASEHISHAKFELARAKKIDQILFEKIAEKYTADGKTITFNKFQDMNNRGKYMNAQEAVDIGLADRIVGK